MLQNDLTFICFAVFLDELITGCYRLKTCYYLVCYNASFYQDELFCILIIEPDSCCRTISCMYVECI